MTMRSGPQETPNIVHQPRGRIVAHALLLAIVALAVGIGAMLPAVATAQTQVPSTGSSPSAADGAALPADVQLRVGETSSLDGGALQVTVAQVIEDSRCPMDVMCVWMGRARVALHVVVDGADRGDVTVTLYPSPRNQPAPELDAMVDRYVLSLTDLQPYPRAGQPQPLDQRIATIHVAPAAP
jgi:hypothetical protein